MYRFIGRHTPEIWALFFTAIFLIGGFDYAWNGEAISLNRAGALIIIVGVLLAASRFHDWLQAKAGHFVEKVFDTTLKDLMVKVEKESGPITEERRNTIATTLRHEIHEELNEFFEKEKKRIKHFEVALIVFGTFLNGFGDYVIGLLKSNIN